MAHVLLTLAAVPTALAVCVRGMLVIAQLSETRDQ
jgi:hypothetical protein